MEVSLIASILITLAAGGAETLCPDVCHHTHTMEDTTHFTMEGRKVRCEDQMCAVMSTNYQKFTAPTKDQYEENQVTFDAKVLKLTGLDTKSNRLDLGLWVGMEWREPSLQLCDCSEAGDRLQAGMDLEGLVWMPQLAVTEAQALTRSEKHHTALQVEDGAKGVKISFSVDLRLTIKCHLVTEYYPFDRNRCLVRVGSYSHTHSGTKFTRGSITSRNIKYKDLVVKVLYMCEEEVTQSDGRMEGFKIILVREGFAVKKLYGFVMDIFMAMAAFSILLPIEWHGVGLLDKSSPIVEAAVSSFYILFDVYSKTPQTSQGRDSILLTLEFSNLMINVCGFILLFIFLLRRIWASQIFGKLKWSTESLNVLLYFFNKASFCLLIFIYVTKTDSFWQDKEIESLSQMYHNHIEEECKCDVTCLKKTVH